MAPPDTKNESKQLLAKQLSSISNILSQAAKRRESDLRKRDNRKPTPAPFAPKTNTYLVDLTSRTSGTDKTEVNGYTTSESGALDLMAKPGLPVNLTHPLNCQVDTASMGPGSVSELKLAIGADDESVALHVDPSGTINYEANGVRLTSTPKETIFTSTVKSSPLMDANNATRLIEDLGQWEQSKTATSLSPEAKDVKKMLGERERTPQSLARTPNKCDPRQMLADLERNARSVKLEGTSSSPNHGDLDEFRSRICDIFSPRQESKDTSSIPWQTEKASCDWEKGAPNSTYFFNERLDGREGLSEKEAYVQRCENELNQQIQLAITEGQVMENTTKIDRRLVVTNIPADADGNDLALIFSKFDA
jgi:hypothetical protein